MLICLKVKYGFPINSLYGFLLKEDYDEWNACLKNYACKAGINAKDGIIYWLVDKCPDQAQFIDIIKQMPLICEDFLELQVFPLANFECLEDFFY